MPVVHLLLSVHSWRVVDTLSTRRRIGCCVRELWFWRLRAAAKAVATLRPYICNQVFRRRALTWEQGPTPLEWILSATHQVRCNVASNRTAESKAKVRVKARMVSMHAVFLSEVVVLYQRRVDSCSGARLTGAA